MVRVSVWLCLHQQIGVDIIGVDVIGIDVIGVDVIGVDVIGVDVIDVDYLLAIGAWDPDCLLLFYILATSMLISGWVPTCDSTHSWWFIELPHWETRMSALCPDIPLSHIILTLTQPILALS